MRKRSIHPGFAGFQGFIRRLFQINHRDSDNIEDLPYVKEKKQENEKVDLLSAIQIDNFENTSQKESMALGIDQVSKVAELPETLIKETGTKSLYEPTLDLQDYEYPTLDLLDEDSNDGTEEELNEEQDRLIGFLKSYGVEVEAGRIFRGDTFSKFEFHPANPVRASKIKVIEEDFYLRIPRKGYRIIVPDILRQYFEIEVPNLNKKIVHAKRMLGSSQFQHSQASLPFVLGAVCSKEPVVVDLAKIENLMVIGSAGSGKTVVLNDCIISLLYCKHPSQLKLVLVDPKKLEFAIYKMIEKHFLAKLPGEDDAIITDTNKAVHTLNALCIEMDNRYDLLKDAGVHNIHEYNEEFIHRRLNPENGHDYLPFIVLVIDEFEDLIMFGGKELPPHVERLVKSGPLVGIFSIISTGNLAFDPIASLMREHIPNRILFKVNQKSLSKAVMDADTGFYLMGEGDMIALLDDERVRLQGMFVHSGEVDKVAEFIADQKGYPEAFLLPEYVDEKEIEKYGFGGGKDPLLEEAAHIIVATQQGSTSLLQRRMKLGYNRAGRLMDQLEALGIVGADMRSAAREVLIKTEDELTAILQNLS